MPHKDIDAKRAYQLMWKRRRQEVINKIKDVPCMDCGGSFPPICMDFDHREDKRFGIADQYSFSLKKVLTEIAKCDIVCANCHRIRTQARGGGAATVSKTVTP